MDIRIVNTCNNKCLYCLEQSYRNEKEFIDLSNIINKLDNKNDKIITFYWWNPLLHPDLINIIEYSKNNGYLSIWLLTNTFWISNYFINKLILAWLTSIWIYFNCFDSKKHNLIVNWWIWLKELINNIKIIKSTWINCKIIIHINKQNINLIWRDIYILNKNFWVKEFEFINYFPFDIPYDLNRSNLEYDEKKNRKNIDYIFKIINKYKLKCKFIKFPKSFFWDFMNYYDFANWIERQIWEEDIVRLSSSKKPFCLLEKRCKNCFIKDKCEILWILKD